MAHKKECQDYKLKTDILYYVYKTTPELGDKLLKYVIPNMITENWSKNHLPKISNIISFWLLIRVYLKPVIPRQNPKWTKPVPLFMTTAHFYHNQSCLYKFDFVIDLLVL